MGLVEDIYGPIVEDEPQERSVYDYDEGPANRSWAGALPVKQGLYDPELEKDACGVGFAAYVLAMAKDGVISLTELQPYQGQGKPQDR